MIILKQIIKDDKRAYCNRIDESTILRFDDTDMTCGVYTITNTKNGKRYVGVSRDVRRRWNAHKAELRRGVHYSDALQEAWNTDGAGAFVFDVLEVCEPAKFSELERAYIQTFRTKDVRYGYNSSNTRGPIRRLDPNDMERLLQAVKAR